MTNVSKSTNLLVKTALLSAISFVFMFFELPLLPAFPWLKIDPSDIPALIGAFAYGPFYGVAIEGFKNVLGFFLKGTNTGGIGEFANFLIGIAFVVPASYIYAKNRTKKNAALGLIAGVVVMSIAGVLANYFILVPLYKNFLVELKETSYVIKYIVYGVIPFNLIKAILVSGITLLIYKKVSALILKESLQFNEEKNSKKSA